MACCQMSPEKAKKFSGGGADRIAIPGLLQRTFWLFCWKLVRVWYLFSLCLWCVFSDCPKWTFWNWPLGFFFFFFFSLSHTAKKHNIISGIFIRPPISTYLFPPLLWFIDVNMILYSTMATNSKENSQCFPFVWEQ